MKVLKYFLAGVCAFAVLCACDSKDETDVEPDTPDVPDVPEVVEGEINLSVGNWNFPAVGELTTEITVTTELEYSISTTAEWLIAEKTGNGISLTAAKNDSSEARTTEVVFTATENEEITAALAVSQDGLAYITANEVSLSFDEDGGSASVTVETNFVWSATASENWITISESESALTVTVASNEDAEAREGTVTLVAGDGAENTAEVVIAVDQAARLPKALILVYDTSLNSGSTQVFLPFRQSDGCRVDVVVDWGDDSELESFTDIGNPTHTYAEDGRYEISVTGTVNWINSRQDITNYANFAKCLVEVKQWGDDMDVQTMERAFESCVNLETVADVTNGMFENVTTFRKAFYECKALKSIPAGMFPGASKATSLEDLFDMCESLTSIPEGLFAGCTAITDASYVFMACTGLTSLPADLFEDCTKITTFYDCFYKDSNLTGESPYSTINGEKVHFYERTEELGFVVPTTTTYCFSMCTELTDYDDIPSSWK